MIVDRSRAVSYNLYCTGELEFLGCKVKGCPTPIGESHACIEKREDRCSPSEVVEAAWVCHLCSEETEKRHRHFSHPGWVAPIWVQTDVVLQIAKGLQKGTYVSKCRSPFTFRSVNDLLYQR